MPSQRILHSAGLAAALSAALVFSACRPAVKGNGLNVLFVTVETTRADHLGLYGYGRDTSPSLTAWAAGGAVFESHSSVSPRTNPSLAALLTATYPHENGVRNLFLPLEPENRTVAEVFRAAGYVTGAVQTHPRLVAASGFAQGFDTYDDAVARHHLAPPACATAWDWIAARRGSKRPWFLWIHLFDPHWTYDPPPPWRTLYGPDDPRPSQVYADLDAGRITNGSVIFQNRMPPDEVAAFVRLYDAEIRYADDALGALLSRLRQEGLDRTTLVVVTADHGESLGEHDYFFEHGDLGTEAEIHVPLLMVLPGTIPSGLRVPFTTSSVDVIPTLVDLAGLPVDPAFRGQSLAPYLRGASAEDRLCFGETDRSLHEENTRRELPGVAGKWRWIRKGRFKLVRIPHGDGRVERRLYDVVLDPLESRDLSEAHPAIAASMARLLDAWVAEDPGQDREYHITPELRRELRSLGYLN